MVKMMKKKEKMMTMKKEKIAKMVVEIKEK